MTASSSPRLSSHSSLSDKKALAYRSEGFFVGHVVHLA
nr:MAG TPA: hypothetical protein [Caudoviricetes sp.]